MIKHSKRNQLKDEFSTQTQESFIAINASAPQTPTPNHKMESLIDLANDSVKPETDFQSKNEIDLKLDLLSK